MGSEMCIRDSHLHRNEWNDQELADCIGTLLNDRSMQVRLAATSAYMHSRHGPTKAAGILNDLLD